MKTPSRKPKKPPATPFLSKVSSVLGETTTNILYAVVLLSVTLVCSMMVARAFGFLIESALGSSTLFGSGRATEETNRQFMFAVLLFLGGHILLSFCLNPKWLGIPGLLLPVPALIGGYILEGAIGLIVISLKDWVHTFDTTGSSLFYKMLSTMTEPTLGFGIVLGITAISVILFSGRKVSVLQVAGSGVGWIVGTSMSLISVLLKLHLPSTPAWIWLSMVFFSELFSKRIKWYGFIVWGAMMVLALLLDLILNRQ